MSSFIIFLIFFGNVNEFKKFNNLLSKCFLYLYKGIISEPENKSEYCKSLSFPYVIIKNLYPKFLLNKLKYFTSLSKAEDSFHVSREYP